MKSQSGVEDPVEMAALEIETALLTASTTPQISCPEDAEFETTCWQVYRPVSGSYE